MSIPITGLTYMVEMARIELASKMFTSGLPSCRNHSHPLMEASYKSPHVLYRLYSFSASNPASKKLYYLSQKKQS